MADSDDRITWAQVEAAPELLGQWKKQDWFSEPATSCYEFQLKEAKQAPKPLLNAACGADPGKLGTLGATNLDLQVKDAVTGSLNDHLPNFTQGTVFDMPFSDEAYASVVLGEFLEHCTEAKAREALAEVKRVLFKDGFLIITVPLDGRPRHEQNVLNPIMGQGALAGDYCDGVTQYHQTWWSNRMLDSLARDAGFAEVRRTILVYPLTCPISGWGLVWRKLS